MSFGFRQKCQQTQELGIRNIINVKIYLLHFNVKVKALHLLYET